MGTSEHIHEPPKEQGRPAIVKIATVNGGHDIDTKRSGKGLFEFVDTLEVNDSGEAESKIQVGKWMWWRFEEAGREDNNMGLPLAILRYKSGYYEVAVLRGVEVPEERPSRRRHQTRVVCSPDCWIIEVENIGSAVTEEETKGEREGYGRVETRNSRGERFSLDRYHFLPHPAHATNPLLIDNIVFDSLVGMEYRLKLASSPPASSLPEPLNSNHAAKRVMNPLEAENGQETEPKANLDVAGQGAGPNAEWTLCLGQKVVPDVEQDTAPEAEPDAERENDSDIRSDAPLNAAETGEMHVRKMSSVSALTPEALSDDDDDDEMMPAAGHRASNEAGSTTGVACANDIPAEAGDEPYLEQDHEFQPTQLFQDLEADLRARSDERLLDRSCTTPVPHTFESYADQAIDSSPKEPLGSMLADTSGSVFGLMNNDRQENDVIDLSPAKDMQNTDLGEEPRIDPLLDGALNLLKGENQISTTAILTTLTTLNIHPDTWLVVDPGSFDGESFVLPSLQDTHRYLITVVNVDNHWTAAVIDRDSGEVDIYDPLQQEDVFRRAWSWLQPRLAHFNKHLSMQQNEFPSWQSRKVQKSSLTYVPPRDLAAFCKDVKDGKPQAESEQLLQVLTLLEETSRQLVANRTALEEEDRRHLQRLKIHGLRKRDARPGFWPSQAETAIDKVIAVIREDHHQAEAKSRPMQDHALSMSRQHEGYLANGIPQLG